MNLQNGYKVIYEKAADGKRTFYASKSTVYPNADDKVLASFNDADYRGKVIYEHKGKFYVSTGAVPAYNEKGEPTDNVIEGFNEVFVKAEEDGSEEEEGPSGDSLMGGSATVDPHTEAISTNGDSHGELFIENNVVTLKATGTIEPATNPNGNTYHHVGFKITAPEGIDPANVVITRPDGKTRVMANILDGANFTNMYWKSTEEDRVFTYYIDWNNDGVNDLTVIIDATKATLVPAEPATEV
jgi:hypothetical protein